MDKKKAIKRVLLIFCGIVLFLVGIFLAGFGTSSQPDELVMYAGLFLGVIGVTIVIFNFYKMFDV